MGDDSEERTVGRAEGAALALTGLLVFGNVAVLLVLLGGVVVTDNAAHAIRETPRECTERALGPEAVGWTPQTPARYTSRKTIEFDVEHRLDGSTAQIRCRVQAEVRDDTDEVLVDHAEIVGDSLPGRTEESP